MNRPSILFINRFYPPASDVYTDGARLLSDMAEAFARDGWHVTVLTTGSKQEENRERGVRVIRIKSFSHSHKLLRKKVRKQNNSADDMADFIKLRNRALKMKGRDVVVTLDDPPMTALIGEALRKRKKSLHVHWCRRVYPDLMKLEDHKLPRMVLKALSKKIQESIKNSSLVITNGPCVERYLRQSALTDKSIAVIQDWPDKSFYSEDSPQNLPFRKVDSARQSEEQLRAGRKFRVLYSGHIDSLHPIETILSAAEILAEKYTDIEFVFSGDGRGVENLSEKRARLGMDNVRILPPPPKGRLRPLMESGDVHLISMNMGAAGMMVPCSVYAGLAAQRPCIFVGPAESTAAQIIERFNAGKVVPQDSPEMLADAIKIYRMEAQAWYDAHDGAAKARETFLPCENAELFVKHVRALV